MTSDVNIQSGAAKNAALLSSPANNLQFLNLISDDAFVNNDVEARAKLLESRVDKMMAEMGNVQKMMMKSSADDTDDDELFEDPSGDFQDNFAKADGPSLNEIDEALKAAVQQLNCDMDHMKARMATLEKLASAHQTKGSSTILGELSGPTTAFVIAWPFVAFAIIRLCSNK